MALRECYACGRMVGAATPTCPGCSAAKPGSPWMAFYMVHRLLIGMLAGIVAIVLGATGFQYLQDFIATSKANQASPPVATDQASDVQPH